MSTAQRTGYRLSHVTVEPTKLKGRFEPPDRSFRRRERTLGDSPIHS